MWLFTTFGFFSIVQKKAGQPLTIRARDEADLERLRERYLPELGTVEAWTGTDYAFRATAPRDAVARAMSQVIEELDYGNFKNAVAADVGHHRAHLYHDVWHAMMNLQESKSAQHSIRGSRSRRSRRKAYGGVVFDDQGRVYVREPTHHYDGYVWSFAKGSAEPGESPEDAALREVRQELGVDAAIEAPIPGEFRGGTSENIYFLMSVVRDTREWELEETTEVRIVDPFEARELLSQTTNRVGRERDLAVLEAALALRFALAVDDVHESTSSERSK